jgi:hypothetical protein
MSISAATNVAIQRRADSPAANVETLPGLEAAAMPPHESGNAVTFALTAIATYIPSEILTLYVAVLAALQMDAGSTPARGDSAWIALWIFFIATPVVVWVLYATKVRAAGKPLPLAAAEWPMWEMSSAAIAYLAWSFAMPGTPFALQQWYSAPLAGIVVLVVSAALGLVAPLFTQRPLPGSASQPVENLR